MINNWLNNSQYSCVLCGDRTTAVTGLCEQCTPLLPHLHNSCRQCASPLSDDNHSHVCGECLRQPPAFDHAICTFYYSHPIDYLIQQMKFHAQLSVTRTLASFMQQSVITRAQPVEAIVPVPLHRQRLRQRGFNQALELARPLARALKIPLLERSVIRKHNTLAQSSLPLSERSNNLKHAFHILEPLSYRSVAIVDDVMTSAQTAHSLALLLKKHGVEQVSIWCIARSVIDT